MVEKKQLSIIIPVLNDNSNLINCLQSLGEIDHSTTEVIVVDNGDDPSVFSLQDQFPHHSFIHRPGGGSFHARNAGASLAQAKHLFFLDADCLLIPGWKEEILKLIEKEVHAAGGKITVYSKQKEQLNACEWYEKIFYLNQEQYIHEEFFAATANFFVKKETFDKIGPFIEGINAENERDWGIRFHKQGYKLHYAQDLVVKHPLRSTHQSLLKCAIRNYCGQYQTKENLSNSLILFKAKTFCYQVYNTLVSDAPLIIKVKLQFIIGYLSLLNLALIINSILGIISFSKLNSMDMKKE